MRTLPHALCLSLLAPVAHAQTACEASAIGPEGEVIATYDLKARGSREVRITWLPERKDGVGQESDFFARPSLLLEYRMTSMGALEGPTALQVMVTRFQPPGGAKPPPISSASIRVRAPGGEPVTWPAQTAEGEAEAARMLRRAAPPSVTAEVLDRSNGLLAASEFDLTGLSNVRRLAQEAKAAAHRRCPDAGEDN